MIIVGYQGIGKSTLAGNNNCIDLESSNFRKNGVRPNDWYVYYCQIAEDLSKQGFTVFTSSHKEVRDYFKQYCTEPIYCVVPSPLLKEEWIAKLTDRYNRTNLDKDYRALKNAETRYTENTEELLTSGLECVVIQNMNYTLKSICEQLKEKKK